MRTEPLHINQISKRANADWIILFTRTYQQHVNEHPAMREAACLRVQFPANLVAPNSEDFFVGRRIYQPIGFDADMSLGYFFDSVEFKKLIDSIQENNQQELRADLQDCYIFWETEQTKAKIRSNYSPHVQHVLSSDNHLEARYAAYPLYRLAGTIPDFQSLLTYGIEGLRQRIQANLNRGDQRNILHAKIYEGFLTVLDVLSNVCEYYTKNDKMVGNNERASLLKALSNRPPANTKEALQLLWLYMLVSGQQNFGRMDEYLGPFVYRDVISQVATKEEILQMLCAFWRLVEQELNLMNARIVIGGRSEVPIEQRLLFSQLALEATSITKVTRPQLSLRYYKELPDSIWEGAMRSIAEGTTFPILYNDEVIIDAVASAFSVSTSLSQTWVPYGCGEYILPGVSHGSPNSIINLLKCLELALNNGVDIFTGQQVGPRTGLRSSLIDFNALWNAYCRQVEYLIEALTEAQWISQKECSKECLFLAISLLQADCMDRGVGILENSSIFHGGLIESYGNVNAAESLHLIYVLVYEEKLASLDEVWEAMEEGQGSLASLLLRCKDVSNFGNGDTDADSFMQMVHEHVCSVSSKFGRAMGFDYYLAVIINNWNNTVQGKACLASIDGRDAHGPLVSGYGSLPGKEKEGLPALLHSLSKLNPNIHAGAVHNIKIDKFSFQTHRITYGEVCKAFFSMGGTQLMITCTSQKELVDAYHHPELHPHLMVRVGGFSARFVSLPAEVQREILARTDIAYA